MKIVVVYKSKSGFTEKYAKWISEKLAADIFEASNVSANLLTSYDTIIYGGGLYAGGINGVKLITKNINKLIDKKIVIFAVGAGPYKEDNINVVINKNFTSNMLEHIKFFYLRGGFNFNKLKGFDKTAMKLMRWFIKRKKELAQDQKDMLQSYDVPTDFTDKENLDQLIEYASSLKTDKGAKEKQKDKIDPELCTCKKKNCIRYKKCDLCRKYHYGKQGLPHCERT